ncbi:glycyl-radical enzyme activating protein [Chloroflexota bacterium]
MVSDSQGLVFNIQKYSIHDGPGIRTVVFLKGCPLRCTWCANPESLNPLPELGFRHSLCNTCGDCMKTCPKGAISINSEDGTISIDRKVCDNCGKCVSDCYRDALALYGKRMSVAEVVSEVLKDMPFYRKSGGGITLSGGEPLYQSAFAMALLKQCHEAGIHTAVETSAYCSPRTLKAALKETDLLFFDLKHLDSATHSRLTGQPNDLILSNTKIIASAGIPVIPRMPLIPTINDSAENIKVTADFLKLINIKVIELMPYHRFGLGKYEALGRQYLLDGVKAPEPGDIARTKEYFQGLDIECTVSV